MENAPGWNDMTAETLADYLTAHATKADDEGRFVASFAMFEAARRLLNLDHWPDLEGLRCAKAARAGAA